MSPFVCSADSTFVFQNRCFNAQVTNGIHETGVNARKSTNVVDSLPMDVRRHG